MSHDVLEERIRAACRAAGLEPRSLVWLPADLSLRRFARVETASPRVPSLIARVEAREDPAGRPAGSPPEPAQEPLRALLAERGLPVPARYGGDPEHGIDLLEDLGDRSLQDAAADLEPSALESLTREACRLVPALQRIGPRSGVAAFGRRLDRAQIAYKAELVVQDGLTARGREPSAGEARVVREAFALVADAVEATPPRLSHRDLQSSNLLLAAPDAPGPRLRLIDFQGAWLAPPEYDLVCLLRDSYVRRSEEEIARHLEAVRPELPDAPDPERFAERFDLLTLARKGKDHARFRYAARTRGDRRFLAHLPTTVHHLRSAARRAADRDPRLERFATLVHELPEDA